MTQIETNVAGIPCLVQMTYCERDYNESGSWVDLEFEIQDRRGRKADWLAKKMTQDDINRIKSELLAARKEEYNESLLDCY